MAVKSIDKLSKNEDTILIKILSFLPIEKAAATSLLSRRWRYVWTRTTSLRINDKFHSTKLFRILIHCAKQLSWDNFHTIDLNLTGVEHFLEVSLSNDVIHDIIFGHNVRIINVKFDPMGRYERKLRLPSCVFEMESLEVLELSNQFELVLPKKGINLPCLKKLEIHICCSQLQFLSNLVASCPLLEHLRFITLLEFSDSCITISSWSLKTLSAGIKFPRPNNDSSKPVLRIFSYTPRLEETDIQEFVGARILYSKLKV